MDDYPKTMTEFQDRFQTEDACLAYLERIRWPEGFHCPRCGHGEAWSIRRGRHMCRKCQAETSVMTGTIFGDVPISLT